MFTLTGTGLPFWSAGWKRYCSTAAMAALSNSGPSDSPFVPAPACRQYRRQARPRRFRRTFPSGHPREISDRPWKPVVGAVNRVGVTFGHLAEHGRGKKYPNASGPLDAAGVDGVRAIPELWIDCAALTCATAAEHSKAEAKTRAPIANTPKELLRSAMECLLPR